jgi:hypothetical protein
MKGLIRNLGLAAILAFSSPTGGTDIGKSIIPNQFCECKVNVKTDLNGLEKARKVAPNFIEDLIYRNPGRKICVDFPVERNYALSTTKLYSVFLDDEQIGILEEEVDNDIKNSVCAPYHRKSYDGRIPSYVNPKIRNGENNYIDTIFGKRTPEDKVFLHICGFQGNRLDGNLDIPFP